MKSISIKEKKQFNKIYVNYKNFENENSYTKKNKNKGKSLRNYEKTYFFNKKNLSLNLKGGFEEVLKKNELEKETTVKRGLIFTLDIGFEKDIDFAIPEHFRKIAFQEIPNLTDNSEEYFSNPENSEFILQEIETIQTIEKFYHENSFVNLFSSKSDDASIFIQELKKFFPNQISDKKGTMKCSFFDINNQNENFILSMHQDNKNVIKSKNETEQSNLETSFSDIIRQKLTKNIYQNIQVCPIFDLFNISTIVLFINLTPSALVDLIGKNNDFKLNQNLINYFNLFYLMLIEAQDFELEKYFSKFAQSIYVNIVEIQRTGLKSIEIKEENFINDSEKAQKIEKIYKQNIPWPQNEQDLIPEEWKDINIEKTVNELLSFHWKNARLCFPEHQEYLNKISNIEWPFQDNIVESGKVFFAEKLCKYFVQINDEESISNLISFNEKKDASDHKNQTLLRRQFPFNFLSAGMFFFVNSKGLFHKAKKFINGLIVKNSPLSLSLEQTNKLRNLDEFWSNVLNQSSQQIAELIKFVDEQNTIPEFGKKAEKIINQINDTFAQLEKNPNYNHNDIVARKLSLLQIVDTSLQTIFLKQIDSIKEKAIEKFKKEIAEEEAQPEFSVFNTDAFFVNEVENCIRPGSSWTYAKERMRLRRIMRDISNRKKQLTAEKLRSSEQQAYSFQLLQQQQAQLHAIQQQQYGGASNMWNIGIAYRPPDSIFNISAGYQQGKANIQITMVPDEQANLLGSTGFTAGVGPGNLGLSLNLNI
jgi:hypothetical protein